MKTRDHAANSWVVIGQKQTAAELSLLCQAVCCADLHPIHSLLSQLLLLRLELGLVLLRRLQRVHGSASREGLGWACTCTRAGQLEDLASKL